LVEIFPGLRAIRIADADGLDTEVYILDCKEGLILIDVGFTPKCHRNIQSELDSMNKKWSDIMMVIITHADGDHINNLPKVMGLTKAEILIGKGDELALQERTGISADVMLETGDMISVCGNIESIRVPGHRDGNLSLFLHKYRTMIAGDTIFGDDADYPHIYPPPEKYSSNVEDARNNLKILMDYDFDALLMSHGRNILSGAKEIVKEMLMRENIL
jgi:glyoxylase-like metal-dependent hydrolase (beta-lactamase superfamily II)